MKKFVFIDTNFCNEDGSCQLHELQAKQQKLTEVDLVTAYMEQEQWDARMVRHGEQWGIVLLSETRTLSAERYEGQQEGYHNGRLIEQLPFGYWRAWICPGSCWRKQSADWSLPETS